MNIFLQPIEIKGKILKSQRFFSSKIALCAYLDPTEKSYILFRAIINIYSTTGEPVHTELYLERYLLESLSKTVSGTKHWTNQRPCKDTASTHPYEKTFSTLAPEGLFLLLLIMELFRRKKTWPQRDDWRPSGVD